MVSRSRRGAHLWAGHGDGDGDVDMVYDGYREGWIVVGGNRAHRLGSGLHVMAGHGGSWRVVAGHVASLSGAVQP